MKLFRFDQSGMARLAAAPVLAAVMVAAIGGLVYLRLSHADTVCITPDGYITSGATGRCVKDAQDMLDGIYQTSPTNFQLFVKSRALQGFDSKGTLASLSSAKDGGNTGDFDTLTLDRVETYQAWHWGPKSSEVDGKLGPLTWDALCVNAKDTTAAAESARVDAGCPDTTAPPGT